MTQEETGMVPSNKRAFIRDGALILYFDTSETPFVARFDLDSLAQAKFEIADKRDGAYVLTLRDFSGEAQDVGRFNTKAEAHQALHAILHALLSHGDTRKNRARFKSPLANFLFSLLKWLASALVAALIAFVLLLALLSPRPQQHSNSNVAPKVSEKAPAAALSVLPEGEAVDADAILGSPGLNNNPAAE